MSRVPETLHFLRRPFLCRQPRMLSDRFCDRGIEAAVQCVELFDADGCLPLERDFGDRLADVAVVVNDLRDVEAGSQ